MLQSTWDCHPEAVEWVNRDAHFMLYHSYFVPDDLQYRGRAQRIGTEWKNVWIRVPHHDIFLYSNEEGFVTLSPSTSSGQALSNG
jgi:hypothetical protein